MAKATSVLTHLVKKLDKMQGILYVQKKLICGMSDKIWYNDMKLKKL
jgi:hypothetical protein